MKIIILDQIKIGTTKLQSINFDLHEGIHVSNIESRHEAYLIRHVLNEIMEEINSLGSIVINKPNDGNEMKYDLFVYGEECNMKLKTIIKRLKERI